MLITMKFVTLVIVHWCYKFAITLSMEGLIYIRWFILIVLAIGVEAIARFLTKGMENKKKRELLLSLIWVTFGVVLIVIWLFTR